MSVAAASGAVSTLHHQPTQEQIRLAQLIDDKKHDQPEVQEIVRKVLDVVAHSSQEDALLALFDCDYDYEKAVALLIEKGDEIASEWRTATNHKLSKKQQKTLGQKNGHGAAGAGEHDENGQQRGNNGFSHRGRSRGGRGRFQQHANGADSHSATQSTDESYAPQQRQRGASGYRGRYRASNRGGHRGNDRNQGSQAYDSTFDPSSPLDATAGATETSSTARQGAGRSKSEHQWDVGNWNGETLIYSRSTKDDEQALGSDTLGVAGTSHSTSGAYNGQSIASELPTTTTLTESNNNNNDDDKSKSEFDPVEAARQIKHVIGIGQSQQPNAPVQPKPLMNLKPLMNDQSTGQPTKSGAVATKFTGQTAQSSKVTTSPAPRIPQQPVIFSDRFDGGMTKIDVQFGNLGDPFDDTSPKKVSKSATSAFYQPTDSMASAQAANHGPASALNSQRAAAGAGPTAHAQSNEHASFASPRAQTNAARPSDQQTMINQQRVLPPQQQQQQQQQQPPMTIKPVVPAQYSVHPQHHPINASNMVLHPLLYHHQQHQQQQEGVALDTSYDPAAFPSPSMDFNVSYFMPSNMNPQQPQQTQPRYIVSQAAPSVQQQTGSNRPSTSTNPQGAAVATSTASAPSSSAAAKKGPAVPPGIFLPTAPPNQQPGYPTAYSASYGIPSYDVDQSFVSAFMPLANLHQAQAPSSVQQAQPNNNNDNNKAMNLRNSLTDEMQLLQQYQQFTSQQQGQQAATHSPAQMSYYLGHPAGAPNYSPGPQIMYAQPAAAMNQRQQGQPYNQNNSSLGMGVNDDYYARPSSSNKEGPFIYAMPSGQSQQVSAQSMGHPQGATKPQQRANAYNNNNNNNQQSQQQQQQQRPFQ